MDDIKVIKGELNRANQEHAKTKEKLYQANEQIKQLNIDKKEMTIKIENHANEIAKLKKEIEKRDERNNKVNSELNKVKSAIKSKDKLIKRLNAGECNKANKMIQKKEDWYKQLEKDNKTAENKIKKLESVIEDLTKNNILDMGKMLKTITNLLNINYITAYEKELGAFIEKLQTIVIRQDKNENSIAENTNEEILGHIEEYLSDIVVIDLDGDSYSVVNSEKTNGFIGLPCVANLMDDGTVKIVKVYKETELSSLSVSKERNRTKNIGKYISNLSCRYSNKLKVMVIGANHLNDYKQLINKVGLEEMCVNPYDENSRIIKGMIEKADIIIACKDSMPHSVHHYLDITKENVVMISKDTKESVLSTINFMVHKLGLATIVNKEA